MTGGGLCLAPHPVGAPDSILEYLASKSARRLDQPMIVRARPAEREVGSRGVKRRHAAREWPRMCARWPGLVADMELAPLHITPRGVP